VGYIYVGFGRIDDYSGVQEHSGQPNTSGMLMVSDRPEADILFPNLLFPRIRQSDALCDCRRFAARAKLGYF